MILSTLVAALTMAAPATQGDLVCIMMGSPTNAKSRAMEYAGSRFAFCCGGCDTAFAKNPTKAMKDANAKGQTFALGLFDPVSGMRVDASKSEFQTDAAGTRYSFQSKANRDAFLKDVKKYTTVPAKDSLTCPVTGEKLDAYSQAAGFVDYNGARYYACCAGCMPALKKDIKALLAKGKSVAATPKPVPAKDAMPMASEAGCCAPGG
ncbi:MAG: YHS domain-containing protein [Fimbriimonadaceae bacterium]